MNSRNLYEEMEFKPAGAGAEELAVAGAVVVAAALPATATHAMISVKGGDVLMAFDADPSVGNAGVYLPNGALRFFSKYALGKARFIQASADAAAQIRIEPGTF